VITSEAIEGLSQGISKINGLERLVLVFEE